MGEMKHRLVLTALLGLLGAACGSSSSDNDSVTPPVGAAGDIVVSGAITRFGSVFANGVEFDTAEATVRMDDEPATIADLRVGMVVSIGGTADSTPGTARASEITFSDEAEGPISSIDRDAGRLVLLGRTFVIDELTVFEGAALEELAAGNIVQVSGLRRSQEQVQATHVHRVAHAYAAGMTLEVKGVINGLHAGTQRFNIGAQACDYSAAALELSGANLANGMYVEASSTRQLEGGVMLLNRVQSRDQHRYRHQLCAGDCSFDLVGYVTTFVSPTEFTVDGEPVTTTPDTAYTNGTADTLALDVKVSIRGELDASGVLVADEIVFHLPSLVEIAGDVEALDSASQSVVVLGITVATNELTMFRDPTATGPAREFGFDDLAAGDRIHVRAVLDAGTVIASRIEREPADTNVILKALVESVDRPSITLLGVTVTSDANTIFQDAAHLEIDADSFFSLVTTGDLVRVEGAYDGAAITASKMFLRDCINTCL
jgi:hypothetical protein